MIADILLSARPAGPALAAVSDQGVAVGEIIAAPSGGQNATPPNFDAILRSAGNMAPPAEGHLGSEEEGVADALPVAAIAAVSQIDPAKPGKTLPDGGKASPQIPAIEPARRDLQVSAPALSAPALSAPVISEPHQQVVALPNAPRTVANLEEHRVEPELVQAKTFRSHVSVETDAQSIQPVGKDGGSKERELRPGTMAPAPLVPEELAQLPRTDRMEPRVGSATAPSAGSPSASDSLAASSQLQPQSQAQSHAPSQPQFAVAVEAPAQGVPKPPAGGLEALVREPGQIETLIENLSQARENGRQARGEMQLRHEDFGVLTVRLANTEGELKASLSSRDPAFAVAAQNALGERVVQSASDSSAASARNGDQPSGNAAHSGQRGTDPQAGGQDRAGCQTQRRDVENRSASTAEDGRDFHAEPQRAPRDRWLFA